MLYPYFRPIPFPYCLYNSILITPCTFFNNSFISNPFNSNHEAYQKCIQNCYNLYKDDEPKYLNCTKQCMQNFLKSNNFNWNAWIDRWLLYKNFTNQWYFGKLKSFDPSTNLITVNALVGEDFVDIEEQQANVIEIWVVNNWTKIYPEYSLAEPLKR